MRPDEVTYLLQVMRTEITDIHLRLRALETETGLEDDPLDPADVCVCEFCREGNDE